jgi:hypothetical protein
VDPARKKKLTPCEQLRRNNKNTIAITAKIILTKRLVITAKIIVLTAAPTMMPVASREGSLAVNPG